MTNGIERNILQQIELIRAELRDIRSRIGDVRTEGYERFERARKFTQEVAERVAWIEGYLETVREDPHPALSRSTGRGKMVGSAHPTSAGRGKRATRVRRLKAS
jgi:hypothetical protein